MIAKIAEMSRMVNAEIDMKFELNDYHRNVSDLVCIVAIDVDKLFKLDCVRYSTVNSCPVQELSNIGQEEILVV